jgi:hypothetical protein
MPIVYVALIAPTDKINFNGKEIKIKDIEIVKIHENGSISFIEKKEYVEPLDKGVELLPAEDYE